MKISRRWIAFAAALLVGVVLFHGYARFPANFTLAPLQADPDARIVVLLFHGSDGQDEPTLVALEARARALAGGRRDVRVLRYRWSPFSDGRFRAGISGERVGRLLGADLAHFPVLESVHLIAHSAGAYIPGPLCDVVKELAPRPVRVDITYLDPIGFYGVLDSGWGARNFGSCGDYVEAFINTDDPAPATNAPLVKAWNVDVTSAPGRAAFAGGGHRWPVQYYLATASEADILPGAHSHQSRPRGAMERR